MTRLFTIATTLLLALPTAAAALTAATAPAMMVGIA